MVKVSLGLGFHRTKCITSLKSLSGYIVKLARRQLNWKLQTAEAVKLHKMQKLAELAQMAHIDKIHQKAKLGRMVLSPQTSEDSETQKNGQTSWIGCFPLNYALFSSVASKKNCFACLQLIMLLLTLSHLIQCFCVFCSQITLLSAFSHQNLFSFVCSLIGLFWTLCHEKQRFSFFIPKLLCFLLYDTEKIFPFVCC